MHVVVHRHVVLDFAVVADGDFIPDEHVLAHGNVLTDSGPAAYVYKVPYARTINYLCAFVYNRAGVNAYRHIAPLLLQERIIITGQSSRRGIANMRHRLDSHSVLFQTKTTPRQNFFIAAGVQVGKAAGEFDLFAIHSDGAERTLALGLGAFRYVFIVHRQEPAHPGFFVFQVAGGHGVVAVVHYIVLQLAEDEMQHVVEVHANVGRNTTRLLRVSLPGLQVPVSTGGDVSQVHFMLGVAFFRLHFVTQRNDRGMHT